MPSQTSTIRSLLVLAVLALFAAPVYGQTAITWQSQTNVTVAATTVTKTGGVDTAPDAGALSLEQAAAGSGGTFAVTATTQSNGVGVGLSNHTGTDSFAVMTHAFSFGGSGIVEIRELGAYQTEASYTSGDVFSIAIDTAGNVIYKKNGTTIDTSSVQATLPTKLDLVINTSGSSITAATFTSSGGPSGETWTVCASGCNYTNAQLQDALTAATCGTTLLLQEGFTYVGDYSIARACGPTTWITVRTGVNATGVVQSVTRYPADGIRICPSTFNVDDMNCSTRPGSTDMTRIAKVKPANNNAYALRTADTGTGTAVSYYAFRWLEFVAHSWGGNSLIGITNESVPVTTGSVAHIPHHFKFDQIVVRGDPITGQFRGMQIDGSFVDLTNSFFYDIKATTEGQGAYANTSVGGHNIINNYMSGGTEVWLTGGAGTNIRPQYTVQAGATTTTVPLDRVTDLYNGKQVAFRLNPTNIASNTAANPTVITTSAAHGLSTGFQVVISGATCSGTINTAWNVTVLSTTTFSVPANCSGGGGAAGSYYVRASERITSIVGNTITVSPALPFAPVTGVLVDSSILIGQGASNVYRYNWFTRPSSWRTTPVQAAVTSPTATASISGGSLAAGTYCYRIVAQRQVPQGQFASATAPAQVCDTVASGTTGSVTVNWTAPSGASQYRVYGRASGAPTMYFLVTSGTSFTDTGSAGTAGSTLPSESFWQVKNTFEFKQHSNATIEYNLIENSWTAGQVGPCVVFTLTQQDRAAHSATMENILFQKNIVRNCAQFLQLPGTDALGHESAQARDVSFIDNLWYNADGALYGPQIGVVLGANGGGRRQHPNRAPLNAVFRRNTFHSTGNTYARLLTFDFCDPRWNDSPESPANGFVWQDNIGYSGNTATYISTALSIGSANPFCGQGFVGRRVGLSPNGPLGTGTTFSHNVFAGDTNCAGYPANVTNLFCPTVAALEADTFTNTTTFLGFKVKATSPYFTASSTGGPIGANIDAFASEITDVTMTGDNSGSTDPGPLTIDTTTPLPTGFIGQSYSVTLAASGGVPPYTWAVTSGTLPNGLTFNTSTGVLSGTPTVAVTNRALTIRVTDSLTTQVSKVFHITIVRLTTRSQRYNWTELATFRRATAPSNPADQVWTGDTWFNTSNGETRVATALGPPIVWSLLTGGGGSAPTGAPATQTLPFWAGPPQTQTPTASGLEFVGVRTARLHADVENSTTCALTLNLVEGTPTVAGNIVKVQHWTGSAWADTGCQASIDVAGPAVVEGARASMAVGARTQDRIFRLWIVNGDGVDTVTIGTVQFRLR